MKKIVWIIILAVFTITFSILEQVAINTILTKVEKETYEIQQIIKENQELLSSTYLKEKVNKLIDYWTDKENLLSYLVNHENTEEIGVNLDQIKSYQKNNKLEEFEEGLSLIIYYCKSYRQILMISMQNIL